MVQQLLWDIDLRIQINSFNLVDVKFRLSISRLQSTREKRFLTKHKNKRKNYGDIEIRKQSRVEFLVYSNACMYTISSTTVHVVSEK